MSITPGEIAGLWADARILFYADDYPPYASPAWVDLGPDDPKRIASALNAAESWRKYGDTTVVDWLWDVTKPRTSFASSKTLAELDSAAAPKPARAVTATLGWPPIAIPGRPGWYRHNIDGRQVDLPNTMSIQEAA